MSGSKDQPTVFISYRRDDASANAGRLFDWLVRQFGSQRIFLDTSKIALGDDFEVVLRQRLDEADVVLVIIGPRWLDIANEQGRRLDQADDYVRMEVAAALAADKRIIPVLVGAADMPGEDALPAPLQALSKRNGTTLRDAAFEQDFDQLVNAILGRPRGYLKTELDRLQRLLRAIKLSTLLVPAVAALVMLALWVGLLDALTLDTRAASYLLWAGEQLSPPAHDPGVLLVRIDRHSVDRLGRDFGPLPAWRRDHARLIDRAAAAGAKAVVFDLFFERDTEADARLAAAAREARLTGTRVVFGARALDGRQPRMAATLRAAADWGSVCINRRLGFTFMAPLGILDPDDLGRATPRAHTPGLALSATQAAALRGVDIDRRLIDLDPLVDAPPGRAPRFSLIRRMRDAGGACETLADGDDAAMLLIRFAGPDYWQSGERSVAYADLLDPAVVADALLRDKILLVGVTLPQFGDRHTVTSGLQRHTLYGVELHANAIANLVAGREVITPTLDASSLIAATAAMGGAFYGYLSAAWPGWRRRVALAGILGGYLALASVLAGQGILLHLLYDATAFLALYAILQRLRNGGFERTKPTLT